MSGSTGGAGPRSEWETRAVAAVEANRARALAEADAVLGPLGQMADVRRFTEISAAELVERWRHDPRPTAVLQLLVDGTGLLDDGSCSTGAPVLRRLTWTAGDGVVREHVSLAAEPWLGATHLNPATNDLYWAQLADFAPVLLPDQLRRLLLGCPETAPARLLVVPTGALPVTFDALPLEPGGPLLGQRAATVVSGSLTMAAALAQDRRASHLTVDPRRTPIAQGVSVYDASLPSAEDDLAALRAALGEPNVRPAETLDELHERLAAGADVDLLAMAVHGDDDAEGWGQWKTLPSGQTLTSVDLLGLDLPPLCVLASCWSSIRQRQGGELGGMPLAMLLRGARSVIGTLIDVHDASTGEIMAFAWPLLAAGEPPADALFHARRQWLTPERVETPLLWAGLVTYGPL